MSVPWRRRRIRLCKRCLSLKSNTLLYSQSLGERPSGQLPNLREQFMDEVCAIGLDGIATDGYLLLSGVFSTPEITAIAAEADAALQADGDATLRAGDGSVYGARNVARLWPNAATLWCRPLLMELLSTILGPHFGLVRVLFFDKPPEQTWALPWHRDLTIAVQDNGLPSNRFRKPTTKAGIPHIHAPHEILEQMLTLRLHLDEVTEENGPLRVIPGSHLSDTADKPPTTILAAAGDVLAMRPLLLHASNRSHPDTRRHRRILHLEFAGARELPDGFQWHEFIAA
jgi:hypothetical protein